MLPVIPNSFLGGSVPCLIKLSGIPFSVFPRLFFSATHLADQNSIDPTTPHAAPLFLCYITMELWVFVDLCVYNKTAEVSVWCVPLPYMGVVWGLNAMRLH